MSWYDLFVWQFRGAIIIALGYAAVQLLLTQLRIESSRARFFAVALVLLAAWCPWSWTYDVPWYPPADAAPAMVAARVTNVERKVVSDEELDLLGGGDVPPLNWPASTNSIASDDELFGGVHPEESRWYRLLGGLWLSHLGGAIALGWWRYGRVAWRSRGPRPDEADLVEEWFAIQREAALPHLLPLRATTDIGPMLGLLPRGFALVVPRVLWRDLTLTQRRAIMKHELAHYLRRDVLTSCCLRLLALPFAYLPFTCRLVALFEESTEWACDQQAIQGGDRIAYARVLERLLESRIPETSLALGRCARSHPLVSRVRRVLNPHSTEESPMKTTMFGAALVVVAFGSLVQVRLTAQEQREATIERVKAQIGVLEERLADTQSKADAAKDSGRQLEARIKERLETLKALGKDPAQWTEDARRRFESLKSGDEPRQLQALEGVDKLGDEGVVLCAYAIQTVEREAVRRKAMSLVCGLGDAGLPVLAKGFETLAAKDRLFTVRELAQHKDKFDALVFARLARDESAEIRAVALEAGLAKGDPLVFLALAADGNESQSKALFDAAKTLKGDDLQLFLFAVAKKGPEELLPETVRRAGALQEAAYPVIAAVYMRKTPESRAAIVRQYRKSTAEVEKFAVQEALRDEDSALRAAAEKAHQEP